MTDIEKVISCLEELSQDDWREYHSDSEVQNIAESALELLKECGSVEYALEILRKNGRKQEHCEAIHVVMCKDCKYWKNHTCYNRIIPCPQHDPDWFCADGERKQATITKEVKQ